MFTNGKKKDNSDKSHDNVTKGQFILRRNFVAFLTAPYRREMETLLHCGVA